MDGAMTRHHWGKPGHNPTDPAKGAVKRSLLIQAHGMPIAMETDGANRHVKKSMEQPLCRPMIERPDRRVKKASKRVWTKARTTTAYLLWWTSSA
jgi:hypothetical protein